MRNKQRLTVWLTSIVVGAVIAVIFKGFEYLVNDGSNWLWNDWLGTDQHRWRVIPVALVLGLIFSLVLWLIKQPRWINPNVGLFDKSETETKTKLSTIGSTLLQGAVGLLAGASLGPEMPLTEASEQVGKWTAGKLELGADAAAIMVAASVGALMVVFMGSMWLVLLPFLLIIQQTKTGVKSLPKKRAQAAVRQALKAAIIPVLLTSASAYLSVLAIHRLFDDERAGYGTIPAIPHASPHDYLAAAVVAVLIGVAAFGLTKLIKRFGQLTEPLFKRQPWWAAAAAGLGIGLFYFVGGQSTEFTGSAGSKLLLANAATYSAWALLGLAIIKLAVTAWSKASGYRGGLFFPSIYASVALGLFVGSLFNVLAGPGVLVGAVAAIFTALMGSWLLAGLIVFALLPKELLPLALLAIVVTGPVNHWLQRRFPA